MLSDILKDKDFNILETKLRILVRLVRLWEKVLKVSYALQKFP